MCYISTMTVEVLYVRPNVAIWSDASWNALAALAALAAAPAVADVGC